MSRWYNLVTKDPSDLSPLGDALLFFNKELETAEAETRIQGNVSQECGRLPGVQSFRNTQFNEVQAILNYLELKLKKAKTDAFKKYLEAYNRSLSSRDADKYADVDDDVMDLSMLIAEVSLVRDRYLSICNALNTKQFQLNNIVRLRTTGMEDYEIIYTSS